MIFQPEMLKTSIYLCGKSFICVRFWLICAKLIKKNRPPTYSIVFVSIFSCSVDIRLRIAVFLLIKWKIKKCVVHRSFWTCYWKHAFFWGGGLTWGDLEFLHFVGLGGNVWRPKPIFTFKRKQIHRCPVATEWLAAILKQNSFLCNMNMKHTLSAHILGYKLFSSKLCSFQKL